MGDVSINTPMEVVDGTEGLSTFVHDQTSPTIDLQFHNNFQNVTLDGNTVLDATTIDLDPGHGFVVGNSICLLEGQNVSQFNVLAVATNTITIDSPVDHIYTPAAETIRHTFNMNVLGTLASPVIFIIKPIPGQVWDITRVIFAIESTANSMDFTEFGSITALINGCVLRTKDGDRQNIFNWKSNGGFINRSFDHSFESKTGGGGSGFVSRSTFGGQSERGVVIHLDGDKGDELQVLIQDDLTAAELTKIFMVAQGHIR